MDSNPYESPELIEDVKQNPLREAFLKRVVWIIPCGIVGMALGSIGAWLLWNYFYGIGSSVISDETYAQFEGDVGRYGAIAGGISGMILACLFGLRGLIILLPQHITGVICGMFAADGGWQNGLFAYGIGQIVAVLITWAAMHKWGGKLIQPALRR